MKLPKDVRAQFAEAGRKGAEIATKRMTKAERVARAKKAVAAREAKRKLKRK